jgi:DNA-binding MarR family transcriptional regulator
MTQPRDRDALRAKLEQACSTVAATCACTTVKLAARAITRFYDAVLAPSGLRATQFAVLVGVFRGFGTSLTSLGRVLNMDRGSLLRNLRPLLRRRLVTTVQATDRRRALRTTRRGERLLARTIPYWQGAQEHVVTTVGPDKWPAFGGKLRDLVKALRGGSLMRPRTLKQENRKEKRSRPSGVQPVANKSGKRRK